MPGVPMTPPVDFAAGVVGTRGKLATSDNDTSSKSPPVSMTPGGKFATSVNNTNGK
jgi:hypothetical protein